MWRIFGLKIYDRCPNVQHLHVHLKNGRGVYFSNDNVEKNVEKPPETTLQHFLAHVRQMVSLKRYYITISRNILHGTIHKKKFNRRKQGIRHSPEILKSDTFDRMYTIHPSNSVFFF